MQPYFFPYIGYFQLMNTVDKFVLYDNIQYTKKGWINRNRILVNNQDAYITVPLKNDSDFLHVKDRMLSDTWSEDKIKMLNRISNSYRKAPYFKEVFPFLEKVMLINKDNLFDFLMSTLIETRDYLEIKTPFVISSEINIDHSLKAEGKVLAICREMKSSIYINPNGGVELYDKNRFAENNIQLKFLRTNQFEYKQFSEEFVNYLSIIDVLMFNTKETVREYLKPSYYTFF